VQRNKVLKTQRSGMEAVTRIRRLHEALTQFFVGRDWEIRGIVLSMLTGYPAVMIGPPGTAKTAIIEVLAKILGLKYEYRLLTRFTQPEELFGPYDIALLRSEGRMRRRIANTIVDADVVFLDELFKASSAILNTLLNILNEKRFFDGEAVIPVKWVLFAGASNEAPDDMELRALYDRMVVRLFPRYIGTSRYRELIRLSYKINRVVSDGSTEVARLVNVREVRVGRDEIESVKQYVYSVGEKIAYEDEEVLRAVATVADSLINHGLFISDRKITRIWNLAVASAVFEGYNTPTAEDIIDAFVLAVPERPEDVDRVREIAVKTLSAATNMDVAHQFEKHVEQLEKQFEELKPLLNEIAKGRISPDEVRTRYREVITAFVNMVSRIEELYNGISKAESGARLASRVEAKKMRMLKEKLVRLGQEASEYVPKIEKVLAKAKR